MAADGKTVMKYFRIYLDTEGFIHSLTYFGPDPPKSNNYISLYGLHVNTLNTLAYRFDKKMVTDIVEFLDQNWAIPLFDDRFLEFSRRLKQVIWDHGKQHEDVHQILSDIEDMQEQVITHIRNTQFINTVFREATYLTMALTDG
jgi:hypothetical protein